MWLGDQVAAPLPQLKGWLMKFLKCNYQLSQAGTAPVASESARAAPERKTEQEIVSRDPTGMRRETQGFLF